MTALRAALHTLWCLPRHLLIALVWLYQKLLSPLFPPTCRYYPSCSVYSIEALQRHGAVVGTVLTAWRLLRCNPFTPGGVDDVPDTLFGAWHRHARRPDPAPSASSVPADDQRSPRAA